MGEGCLKAPCLALARMAWVGPRPDASLEAAPWPRCAQLPSGASKPSGASSLALAAPSVGAPQSEAPTSSAAIAFAAARGASRKREDRAQRGPLPSAAAAPCGWPQPPSPWGEADERPKTSEGRRNLRPRPAGTDPEAATAARPPAHRDAGTTEARARRRSPAAAAGAAAAHHPWRSHCRSGDPAQVHPGRAPEKAGAPASRPCSGVPRRSPAAAAAVEEASRTSRGP